MAPRSYIPMMPRRCGLRIETKVRKPIEQGPDADRHLGPGDVHAQADVRTAAEGE